MSILQKLYDVADSEDWGDICETYKRVPEDVVLTESQDQEETEE